MGIMLQMSNEIEQMRIELARLLDNFPHPRNQPAEAVDALHHARQLRDQIEQCQKEQADHAANQDARP